MISDLSLVAWGESVFLFQKALHAVASRSRPSRVGLQRPACVPIGGAVLRVPIVGPVADGCPIERNVSDIVG